VIGEDSTYTLGRIGCRETMLSPRYYHMIGPLGSVVH
jgi:hypothetical protein